MNFDERAEGMGLTRSTAFGGYLYSDRFSSVLYSRLFTQAGKRTPYIGVCTALSGEPDFDKFKFVTYVSDQYQFYGNELFINEVRNSLINEVNAPIHHEETYLLSNLSEMFHHLTIRNAKEVPETGDVYPLITISNSYIGTRSLYMNFGLTIVNATRRHYFNFSKIDIMGNTKQVHHKGFKAKVVQMGKYLEIFDGNIMDFISYNSSLPVDNDALMSILGLIDTFSKKKKLELGTLLDNDKRERPIVSTWDLFRILVEYSSGEKNLNVKRYIENMAESVLQVPGGMQDAIDRINERVGEVE